MTTTLEKAARAAWCVNPLERGPFRAKQYEYIASAVLMAVRDEHESEVMKKAWKDAWDPHMQEHYLDETWPAMIDAILNEGEG